jgi:hypothetical protein
VSVGCWEALGSAVEDTDGSLLGDIKGTPKGSLTLGDIEGAAKGSLLFVIEGDPGSALLCIIEGDEDDSELCSALGATKGFAEGGSVASVGGALGVVDVKLDGTSLSATILVWSALCLEVGAVAWAAVGAAVWCAFGAAIWAAVGDSVDLVVGAAVRDEVSAAIWATVGGVAAALWAGLGKVGKSVWISDSSSVGQRPQLHPLLLK